MNAGRLANVSVQLANRLHTLANWSLAKQPVNEKMRVREIGIALY